MKRFLHSVFTSSKSLLAIELINHNQPKDILALLGKRQGNGMIGLPLLGVRALALATLLVSGYSSQVAQADDADENYEIYGVQRPSQAGFLISKALMPQGLSFYGLSVEELGVTSLSGGFEYRNFKMYRGALKVSVYQGGQHLAEHTFLRAHLLRDVNLRVLNSQFTGRLNMPEQNGELTPAQFFQPFENECGELRGEYRKAKVSGQTYFYLSCPKFGSNFFMARQQRGIGLVQTLGSSLDANITEGTDSGRQNLVVTDYVLSSDGNRLPGNPFKILQNIPLPVAIANYFLSSDYDLDDHFLRKQNFIQDIEYDQRHLSAEAEDKWINALATYTTFIRDSQGNKTAGDQKTFKISHSPRGSMKLLRHAVNDIGNSISYYASTDKKAKAVSVSFTPLLAGYPNIEELAETLSVEPFCLGKRGMQRVDINNLEVYQIECKQTFSSSELKKTFLLIPVVMEGMEMPKDVTPEEAEALKSFEIIMLLGDLSLDDISDVVSAVTLSQGWNWNINPDNLTEYELTFMRDIPNVKEWHDAFVRNPDNGGPWRTFLAKTEDLLEGNVSRDFDVVKSILSQAAEKTSKELEAAKDRR